MLERFSRDPKLSEQFRKTLQETAKIDSELRKLRRQATRLTRVVHRMAPSLAVAAAVSPAPAVTVFDCQQIQTLPGVQVDEPKTSTDATVRQVATTTKAVAGFYQQMFGRNSIDNAGMTLVSSVHYGLNYPNAFWNGSQMAYGDGDGQLFLDFSQGNDVIAHELTHGVTQHSLELDYSGEAGGLNESISDCFAIMFRQWQAQHPPDEAEWLIGTDIVGPAARAEGITCLRDMAAPKAKHCIMAQADTYDDSIAKLDPHISSGVPNLAFCTIVKATKENSWERVGKIWYDALTLGPSPSMRMKTFADRTRSATAQRYPNDKALAQVVDAGWKAVGL